MIYTCTWHNGISCLNSLNNSREIAKFVGWTERPSHHDIKWIFCQKSHLTRGNLMFFYFLKLNIICSMAIRPNESKKMIIILCFLLKKNHFISFYWAKKKFEQNKCCQKNLQNPKMNGKLSISYLFWKPMPLTNS